MKIIIKNLSAGTLEKREMTSEEIAEMNKIEANAEALEAERLAKQEAKAAAKEAAHEKLAALGLTAEEIAAITGGN